MEMFLARDGGLGRRGPDRLIQRKSMAYWHGEEKATHLRIDLLDF
jgi:hypothetical protein